MASLFPRARSWSKLTVLVGCLLGALLSGLSGCTSSVDPNTSAAPDGKAARQAVTLMLNWFPEAEHGGYYAALTHGYYEEEGLDVTIQPGGPKAPVLQNVADGIVTFGVDNADKLVLARAQQADIVALLAPIQTSPRCIMVRQDSPVKTFEDLARQPEWTLAMNTGQPFALYLQKRLDLGNVQIVPYSGNVAPFLLEDHYGQQAYTFSEPFIAEEKGVETRTLLVADIGFNPYTSLLIAGRKVLDEQPEIVAKMVRASRRGWQTYLDSPEETNVTIHQENPEMGQSVLEFGVKALEPLCLPSSLPPEKLGQMTEARWTELVSQMVEIGSIEPERVTAESCWTEKFLKP